MIWTAIAAGLANWIATTILVESEITRPIREWVQQHRVRYTERPPTEAEKLRMMAYGDHAPEIVEVQTHHRVWWKVSYLLGCHLCSGTWIAAAEALVLGNLIGTGFFGFVLTTLLIKAIGHFTLELTALFRRWSQA